MSLIPLPVVIVHYHSFHRLSECLDNLFQQTHPFSEIVIVDNGSSELEKQKLKSLNQKERIRVIFSSENIGFAKANNLAFAQLGHHPYIALLNPDAIPDHDWLEKMAHAIEAYPETSAFGSFMTQYHHPELIDGIGDCYHFSGLAWRASHGKKVGTKPLHSYPIFSACAASACYKTSVLNELEGFDEDLFCYQEDVDLGFRILLSGGESRFIPEAKVKHVGLEASKGDRNFSFYHGHRNLEWVYFKNMPLGLLFLFLPAHIMMIMVILVVASMRGQGLTYLKAKIDALKQLSLFIEKRKTVISTQGLFSLKLLGKFNYLPNFRSMRK